MTNGLISIITDNILVTSVRAKSIAKIAKLINIKMNLKVFCVSFINLLVALAVPAANASPSNPESFLSQSTIEYKNSNFYKSDYLIAKYFLIRRINKNFFDFKEFCK